MADKPEVKKPNEGKEIAKEVVISSVMAGLVHLLMDSAKGFKEKVVDPTGALLMKKITDENRTQLLNFIRCELGNDEAQKVLWRHYRRSMKKPGGENRFVTLLTKAWVALDDKKPKTALKRRQKFFVKLSEMKNKEFEQALYFLENDVLPQWFKRAEEKVGDTAKWIHEKIYSKTAANKPLSPLEEIRSLIADFWRSGNEIARIVILFLVGWPIGLLIMAANGMSQNLIITMAILLPVVGLIFLLITAPLIIPLMGLTKPGRAIWRIVGIELLIGTYFIFVPIGTNPHLIPFLILAALLIVIFGLARSGWALVGWIMLVFLTINFLNGGQHHSEKELTLKSLIQPVQKQPAQQAIVQLPPPLVIELEPGEWSDWKEVKGPAGTYRHFEGPFGTRVRYEDGTEGLITENFGVRGGDLSFENDCGGTVRVIVNFDPIQ